jgi:hypothetical protein
MKDTKTPAETEEPPEYLGYDDWLDRLEELIPPVEPTHLAEYFKQSCTNTEDFCAVHGVPYNDCDCI